MTTEQHNNLIKSIQEKIGEEVSASIADDLGVLITDNANMNEMITTKETQIQDLQKNKEMLINTNNKLLQQVGFGVEIEEKETVKEPKKEFSYRNCFDEKGNFIQ